MLIKFAIFDLDGRKWILPANIDPVPQPTALRVFRGGYRIATKLAIEELGTRRKNPQWQKVAPNTIDRSKRKTMVWRDGMSEYILDLFREAAWQGLNGMPRSLIFHASVDEQFELVEVGRNVGKRVILKKVGNDTSEEHSQTSPSEEGYAEQTGHEQSSRDGDISTDSSLPETDFKQPPITAVFFKGPPSFIDEWEFKLIKIENQSTYATLFNIRRLLPVNTEQFFSRFDTSDTIAIASSKLYIPKIMANMLRLSLYMKGDVNANVTFDVMNERNK